MTVLTPSFLGKAENSCLSALLASLGLFVLIRISYDVGEGREYGTASHMHLFRFSLNACGRSGTISDSRAASSHRSSHPQHLC